MVDDIMVSGQDFCQGNFGKLLEEKRDSFVQARVQQVGRQTKKCIRRVERRRRDKGEEGRERGGRERRERENSAMISMSCSCC